MGLLEVLGKKAFPVSDAEGPLDVPRGVPA
jgi:hypothetical protein